MQPHPLRAGLGQFGQVRLDRLSLPQNDTGITQTSARHLASDGHFMESIGTRPRKLKEHFQRFS